MQQQCYRIEEVCLMLALGRTKVYDEIKAGRLGTIRVGKSVRVPHDELLRFVERASVAAGLRPAMPPSLGNGEP